MEKTFKVGTRQFHPDPNFNYQMNRWAAFGDLPEDAVRKAAAKITDINDWCREFLGLARDAESKGDVQRAAFYYRSVDFFLPYGHPEKMEIHDRTVALLRELHAPWFENRRIVESYVPYGQGRMPAWHAPANRAEKKGTILFTGGFDCIKEELVPVLLTFSDKGYDILYFEGPGQGETLAKEGIPMTPLWEKPVSAVLDHFGLSEVTIVGLSLGGYLAPRAAVFDKRIKRIVSWGIMYDFFDIAVSRRGPFLNALLRTLLFFRLSGVVNALVGWKMKRDPYMHWGVDHGMRVMGVASPYDYFREMKKYSLKALTGKVEQDVLLTTGTDDHFVPLSHYHRLSKGLVNAKSVTGRVFSSKESAENHCQFGNVPLTLEVIADWIDLQSAELPGRM
ncbi:MAG: alpha/beta hydrolase [Thermodesulfobacteriota bacterium]